MPRLCNGPVLGPESFWRNAQKVHDQDLWCLATFAASLAHREQKTNLATR